MGFPLVTLVMALLCVSLSFADTPANCSYADVMGKWTVFETLRGNDNTIGDCADTSESYVWKREITLQHLSIATDEFGNTGLWTLIYNQGFEVAVAGRKYFFFSKYDKSINKSICTQTQAGWSHTLGGMDWSCARATRFPVVSTFQPIRYKNNKERFHQNVGVNKSEKYRHNGEFIDSINSLQRSWKAVHYKHYDTLTLNDMHLMAGGTKSKIAGIPYPSPHPLTDELKEKFVSLPEAFDWRNVNGRNFVSPVRNQGSCGSCYAFSSMAMHEARLRVMTNMSREVIFSPQDVVECSHYSQGCDGGFPYLIAGKYASDFGLAPETCNPYTGKDGACSTTANCSRNFGFDYRYVGGFYGACNEQLMKLALMRGPVSVAFEVYSDFFQYKGGVYHHVEGLEDKFNPFEITNHAVLLVGYGVDPTAGPYWTVKNSWGSSWGEDGFFRIRRGTDECSIESIAVESFPVL